MTRTSPTKEMVLEPIRQRPITDIRPAPENDKVYSPVDPDAPDIVELADSIRRHGVQEPLIVSDDGFIISGHRRYAAALRLGLDTVPCRVAAAVNRNGDRAGFVRLLVECNRQRVKRFDEALREKAITADPETEYANLLAHRIGRSEIHVDTLDLGERKRRTKITKSRMPFLAAVKNVIDELKPYWPLSARQIHYRLLNGPPLTHAGKPVSKYRNDMSSYRKLIRLLDPARRDGLIPHEIIDDDTRPVTTWDVSENVDEYIGGTINKLFMDYWRDPLQSQPNHLELIVEKNTVLRILEPVACEFGMPLTSTRGQSSLPPLRDITKRYRRSGKDKLVLLIASDLDPAGETIAYSVARTLRDDFRIPSVQALKVAITGRQVREFNLPPGEKAKAKCSARKAFVERHGEHTFELEAFEPDTLQSIVRESIKGVLDTEAFNHEVDLARLDAAHLATLRQTIMEALQC